MKKSIGLLIVVLVLFGLVLGGCVKPASEAPEGETTNGEQADVVVRVMATQTALAKAAEGDADSLEPTAEPTAEPTEETSDDSGEPAATATEEVVVEPTEEPTPAPTVVVSVPGTYTVHYGEHPYCLARRFDVDADELLGVNGLVRGDQIEPGDVLTIPQDGSPFNGDRVLSTHPASFTVQYLDTFYSIACYFGDVTPEAIAEANGMTVDEVLVTGTVIQIP